MNSDAVDAVFDDIRRGHRAAVDQLQRKLADEDRAYGASDDDSALMSNSADRVPSVASDDEQFPVRRWLRSSW